MPKYRYQTTDAQGNPVSGEVEGAGREGARRKLAAQGFDAETAQLTEISETSAIEEDTREDASPEDVSPEDTSREDTVRKDTVGKDVVRPGGRLTGDEAVEVATQVAQLAKGRLPLASGLRAMAEEMPRRRAAAALRQLADQLDAGLSLEAALESLGRRFPAHVRGLILAGLHTGRLPEAMEEFVAVEGDRVELARKVWVALAYPGLLILVLLALGCGICAFVIPQFRTIFEEFGAELPYATEMLMWLGGPGLGVAFGLPVLLLVGIVFLALARGVAWTRSVLYVVPLIGPVWRWAGLSNLSRLMSLLLGQQVPLPSALRLTAAGLREADLAIACQQVALEVEGGRPLSDCLADFRQFPPSLRPLVRWGEQTSNPAAAFRAGAEMFESRVHVRVSILQTVLPPFVFLLIIAGVFYLVWGLFAPLVSLIQNLT